MNVISAGLPAKDGFKFLIKDDIYDIILNDITIMHGLLNYGIYLLS